MNQAPPDQSDNNGVRRFFIEMLGFPDAEKSLLSSTFRLTVRRAFAYVEPSGIDERPDLYLVNADNAAALQDMADRSNVHVPAVLIGSNADDHGWPVVEKPIHWMRLFEQLDLVMQSALLERARRRLVSSGPWDGRTFRRSIDHTPAAGSEFIEAKPIESVLVVDDSATIRAFMRSRLTPFRFDVDYAASGEKAIDMTQTKHYTCIFLDVLMPGIDGYEVCKRIKSSPATRDTAVVMLSSRSSAIDKFRGNWAGCDAYLGKPVGEDELLATIARFLPSARKVAKAILNTSTS